MTYQHRPKHHGIPGAGSFQAFVPILAAPSPPFSIPVAPAFPHREPVHKDSALLWEALSSSFSIHSVISTRRMRGPTLNLAGIPGSVWTANTATDGPLPAVQTPVRFNGPQNSLPTPETPSFSPDITFGAVNWSVESP
ncbi:hypothetical protein C8J56DRAFT_1058004 [Mycena floridula]|nr:hypothetical protein C8J56DRAFT_1058004 [Mycena floridula]